MDEDAIKTQLITKIKWLAPVSHPDELPLDGVEDGAHCFVEGEADDAEEEIWMFRAGAWTRIDEL
jgi:hypothetical protein